MRLNSLRNTTALATKFQRHFINIKNPKKERKKKYKRDKKKRGQRAKGGGKKRKKEKKTLSINSNSCI
jgi:hypothetical protein